MYTDLFPDVKTLKTYNGAKKRIDEFLANLPEGDKPPTFVIQARADGTFFPVAFMGDANAWMMTWLMDCGIGVTN